MGWFINYEVEFDSYIDWDDEVVDASLGSFDVKYLYLRDLDKPRIALCIYSHNTIKEVLDVLKQLYATEMRWRIYNTEGWNFFVN